MALAAAPTADNRNALSAALEAIRQDFVAVLRVTLLVAIITTLVSIGLVWLRLEMFALPIPASSLQTASGLGLLILLTVAVFGCVSHLRSWLLATLSGRLARRLAVPACVVAADSGALAGERSAQALQDIEELNRGITGSVGHTTIDFAMIPLYIGTLLLLHWIFAVIAVVAVICAAMVSIVVERMLRGDLAAANALRLRNAGAIADAVRNAEAVEAHGMLPALADGWAVEVNDLEALMVRVERITRIGDGIQTAIQAFARGGVILLSALLAETSIQLGGLLVYSLLIIAIVARPFSHMADFFHQLGEVRMAWARLRNLANQPRRRGQAERGYSAPVGRLVVEQLTVLLPGMVRPLLRDVNLVVGPGDVVGIAGNVGSGKSTLLRAVMGMIRPTAGACFLDGHATWQWDRVDIARHVGFLPQDPGLSDGTVAEAIARLDVPNMAMVIEAATRAGAHQTIVALPQGYATPLSETMLSAGQRQRIALARAIYGRPRLVVLDEPSSWLDDAGMAQLIRLFAILKADGCGVLFSSHNLDLVDAADHVLAMRAGVLGTRRAPAALAGPQGSSQGAKPA